MISGIQASLVDFEIGLSGAVPDRSEWDEPAQDRAILEFVALLSGLVLKYGGRVVHGSHPTFTPVILRQAQLHGAERRGRPPVTLVMSELWAKDLDKSERELFEQTTEFITVPQVGGGGPERDEVRNQSLTAMRRRLIGSMNVLVALGGKRHTGQRRVPGVAEELYLAQERGMACFVVGGFGGMAASLADRFAAEDLPKLNNELPEDENRTLLRTKDIAACVSIIFDHVARNPSLAKRPLKDLMARPEQLGS